MSPSQDGPAQAPTSAPTLSFDIQAVAAPGAAAEEAQPQQQPAAPVALIPIAAFRSNPAGIPAPADALARSERAVDRVLGALPRVDTGPPNRRTGMTRLALGLGGIEGALDVEEERAASTATLLTSARVENISRQSDILAEIVLTAEGTETTKKGQPVACRELRELLGTKTVAGAMTTAFYMIALGMAWRVCLQVRPTIIAELAAGFFYLSDLRELARRAFGFRLRIERGGRLTPVHLRIYSKGGVDFFAMVDQARAKGVERRGNAKERKHRLCAFFHPRVRAEALRLAASGATTVIVDGGASAAAAGAGASSSCLLGSAASGFGSCGGLLTLLQPAAAAATDGAAAAAADAQGAPPTAAELIGNLELPPGGSIRLNDREMADLLDHLALDEDDEDDDADGLARKRVAPEEDDDADEPDDGPAQCRQRTNASESALDGSDGGRNWSGDDGGGSGDDAPAGTAALSPAGLPGTHSAQAPGPKTNRAALPRADAPRAVLAACAVPAAAPRTVPSDLLASSNAAAVVKHLRGEDLGAVERWAAPLVLDGASTFLGARISPAGRVELAAPTASFLSRLRAGLSGAGRLLLDVGGRAAWLANQKQVGSTPLFSLGLGEAFSSVARVDHHASAPRAADNDSGAAAAAAAAAAVASDYASGGRVLVLWLDPARLRGHEDEADGTTPAAPLKLSLSGGGGPVPLEHGTVLVSSGQPGDGDDGGGSGAPSYTVRCASCRTSSCRRARGQPATLVELRFYISARVAQHCTVAGEGAVRREAADSVRAL